MPIDPSSPPPLSGTRRPPVPGLSKLGAGVIAFGVLFDLVEHDLSHVGEAHIGAFPIAEHLAHFVVLLGMVLVLAGIVADGVQLERRRRRQEGASRHAVR
jgi:uncharacterized membrane protein YidH (DUF202 family)